MKRHAGLFTPPWYMIVPGIGMFAGVVAVFIIFGLVAWGFLDHHRGVDLVMKTLSLTAVPIALFVIATATAIFRDD